jgi:hypothetical protein
MRRRINRCMVLKPRLHQESVGNKKKPSRNQANGHFNPWRFFVGRFFCPHLNCFQLKGTVGFSSSVAAIGLQPITLNAVLRYHGEGFFSTSRRTGELVILSKSAKFRCPIGVLFLPVQNRSESFRSTFFVCVFVRNWLSKHELHEGNQYFCCRFES